MGLIRRATPETPETPTVRHGILRTRDGEYQLCHADARVPRVIAADIPVAVHARYRRVMLGAHAATRAARAAHPEYATLQAELYGLAVVERHLLRLDPLTDPA